MKNIISCLLLSLFCLACANKETPLLPEYEEGLTRYFDEVHGVATTDMAEVVIVPLSGCNPCIADVLEHLANKPLDIDIVLTGTNEEVAILSHIESLDADYHILRDENDVFRRYRTSLIGPTWLSFGSNGLEELEKLETANLTTVLN